MIAFWIQNAIWIHQVIKYFNIRLILPNYFLSILYITCLITPVKLNDNIEYDNIYPYPVKSNKDVCKSKPRTECCGVPEVVPLMKSWQSGRLSWLRASNGFLCSLIVSAGHSWTQGSLGDEGTDAIVPFSLHLLLSCSLFCTDDLC